MQMLKGKIMRLIIRSVNELVALFFAGTDPGSGQNIEQQNIESQNIERKKIERQNIEVAKCRISKISNKQKYRNA